MSPSSVSMKMARSEHQEPSCRGIGLDSMPELVRDAILARLPIRDAVRTSLLSRWWRYRWEHMPDLVFDGRAFPVLYSWGRQRVKKSERDSSIASFVNRVLLLHRAGTIRKFELSSVPFFNGLRVMLDNWATKLARSGVKILILSLELDYRSTSSARYLVHKDFFFCHGLTSLLFSECHIRLPDGFTGFPCLTNLTIKDVDVSDADLGRLVSSSPKLQQLYISSCKCDYVPEFDMYAPSLQHLELRGLASLERASIDAPLLFCADITFSSPESSSTNCEVGANLSNLLRSSTNIQMLQISNHPTEILPVVHDPPTLIFLRFLSIQWNFDCKKQTHCSMELIKSFPALNHVQVENNMYFLASEPLGNYWEEDHGAAGFSSLKSLDFRINVVTEAEMKFIDFVLKEAPLLEHVQLMVHAAIHSKNKRKLDALLKAKRPSTKVTFNLFRGFGSRFITKLLPRVLDKA